MTENIIANIRRRRQERIEKDGNQTGQMQIFFAQNHVCNFIMSKT